MILIIVIQFATILYFVASSLIKSRILYKSIISVGKIGYYLPQDEDELRKSPAAIRSFLKYIDNRIRMISTEQNSELFDKTGKEIIKSVELIYNERGQMRQLGEIRSFLASLSKEEKE